jgi:O-antigen ligase
LSLIEIKVLLDLGGFTAGIVGLFLQKNLLTLGWGRSNYLASFFVMIIPLAIGYFMYSKSRILKVLIITALVLMSFAIILTLSRGGILALLIAMVILFSRVLKVKTFIPLISILILITTVLLLNPLTIVLFERVSSLDASGSVFSRINFYQEVWQAFLAHPLTGVGIGNLGNYATFILPPDNSPSAHNLVLGALGEIGIIGTTLYLTLFVLIIRKTYSNFKIEKDDALRIFKWCCFSSLLGGLIHSLVEPIFEGMQFSIIFWTLAGIYLNLDLLKTSE